MNPKEKRRQNRKQRRGAASHRGQLAAKRRWEHQAALWNEMAGVVLMLDAWAAVGSRVEGKESYFTGVLDTLEVLEYHLNRLAGRASKPPAALLEIKQLLEQQVKEKEDGLGL